MAGKFQRHYEHAVPGRQHWQTLLEKKTYCEGPGWPVYRIGNEGSQDWQKFKDFMAARPTPEPQDVRWNITLRWDRCHTGVGCKHCQRIPRQAAPAAMFNNFDFPVVPPLVESVRVRPGHWTHDQRPPPWYDQSQPHHRQPQCGQSRLACNLDNSDFV
eukprot:Skav215514  [mRNA]  locus=scaffold827:105409:105882:- [translate_table: standard]